MGKADLHLHTTASDGMMSPAMLMNYIAACTDLDVIAITDHNTQDGWAVSGARIPTSPGKRSSAPTRTRARYRGVITRRSCFGYRGESDHSQRYERCGNDCGHT